VLGIALAESMADHHDVEVFAAGDEEYADTDFRLKRPWSKLDGRIGRVAAKVRGDDPSRPITSTVWPFLGYSASVAAATRTDHLQLVHIHIYDQLVPPIHAVSPSTPIVLHLHDHSQTQRDRKSVASHMASASAVVGCSEFIAEAARQRFPEFAHKITSIPNATQVPATPPALPSTPGVVFVGRISPEKGVHVLAEAFRKVHEKIPEAKLTLVGPYSPAPIEFVDPFGNDPLFDSVRHVWGGRQYSEFVREALGPAAENTEMVGGLTHDETKKFIEGATALVMPSLWDEPFGMPTIEAMALGRPVIATRGGAFPSIVEDGVTGHLIEKADVDGLAEALCGVLSDSAASQQMGTAGHRRALEHFSWDSYVDRWDDLYERLVR
jgi:glycosyltransferase involved in cell wall biosynthesis